METLSEILERLGDLESKIEELTEAVERAIDRIEDESRSRVWDED